MYIILKCTGNFDVVPTGYDAACLEVTEELKGRIRALITVAKALKAGESQFYDLSYWDSTIDVFDASILGESLERTLNEGEVMSLASLPEYKRHRIECCTLHVTSDGVRWCFYPKHTSSEFSTSTVTLNMLDEL